MMWEIIINGSIRVIDVDFKIGKTWKDMEKISI